MIPWGMTFTMLILGLEKVFKVAIPTFFVALAATSSAMALFSALDSDTVDVLRVDLYALIMSRAERHGINIIHVAAGVSIDD